MTWCALLGYLVGALTGFFVFAMLQVMGQASRHEEHRRLRTTAKRAVSVYFYGESSEFIAAMDDLHAALNESL